MSLIMNTEDRRPTKLIEVN